MAPQILIVLSLVLLNGFFAMSELAIVCARRARLQRRADSGSNGARMALELANNPTRFLSTVQIGITLVGILAGAFGAATIAGLVAVRLIEAGVTQRAADPVAIASVVLVLTLLSLVIGELVPKRIALVNPDAIASAVAPTIAIMSRIAHPVVTFLQLATDAVLRLFGIRSETHTAVTDEEINALVAEGAHEGSIDPSERQMVEQVLRLADRPIRTIMTRRSDLVWLNVGDSTDDVRRRIADNGYSRLLVCEDTLDNCLGYVRARTIVDRLLEETPLDLQSLIREPLRVGPELRTLQLMARFRRARPHIALVTDEYGTTLGLVTPADVFEAIGGQLPGDAATSNQIVRRDDDSWLVDAQIELHDLERALDARGLATKTEFMTLAGLILEYVKRIPRTGEVIVVNGWRLEVIDVFVNRIDKVLMGRPSGRSTRLQFH
jgi:putative hemolysin